MTIKGGYKFKRGNNIFKNFVLDTYGKRVSAGLIKNEALKHTYKLILNSLFGRFGMREIENRVEIVDEFKLNNIGKNKNVLSIIPLHNTNKFLVVFNTNISKEAVDLIEAVNPELKDTDKDKTLNFDRSRGVPSSVAIAAAITGYAQIMLMEIKADPDNRLLYSETDSALVEKPLQDSMVSSTNLGAFKLEHVVVEGIFVKPKLYAFKNNKGEIIIKSKGVKNKLLN